MNLYRRSLLQAIAAGAVTTAFGGLQVLQASGTVVRSRFGELRPDVGGIFDLPEGFSYRIIATSGEEMADGLVRPARPDGMAAFSAPSGRVILVCNHENSPDDLHDGAFGSDNARLDDARRARLFDASDEAIGQGGTTTMIYDPASGALERQFLSLGGTERNCAGGPTPWGTWLSCEETVARSTDALRSRNHGWVFEVPAVTDGGLVQPEPLKALGRFKHEAAAVSADERVIYLTEDQGDGLFYRTILRQPGKPAAGGRLQALAVTGRDGLDTRNWEHVAVQPGERLPVRWVDLDNPESPNDDLRYRGQNDGAAVFARGEGAWAGNDAIYFACTSGGAARVGQIFRYVPAASDKDGDGYLELFVESDGSSLLRNADNLTVTPWGDLLVCEDTDDHCSLIGVTPAGETYLFARNLYTWSELAGACFSPDGRTLFVNIQVSGLTLAITGPFPVA